MGIPQKTVIEYLGDRTVVTCANQRRETRAIGKFDFRDGLFANAMVGAIFVVPY